MTFTFNCEKCKTKVSMVDEAPRRDPFGRALCTPCATKFYPKPDSMKYLRPIRHVGWRNGQHVIT